MPKSEIVKNVAAAMVGEDLMMIVETNTAARRFLLDDDQARRLVADLLIRPMQRAAQKRAGPPSPSPP